MPSLHRQDRQRLVTAGAELVNVTSARGFRQTACNVSNAHSAPIPLHSKAVSNIFTIWVSPSVLLAYISSFHYSSSCIAGFQPLPLQLPLQSEVSQSTLVNTPRPMQDSLYQQLVDQHTLSRLDTKVLNDPFRRLAVHAGRELRVVLEALEKKPWNIAELEGWCCGLGVHKSPATAEIGETG